jgi:hypothetical protein
MNTRILVVACLSVIASLSQSAYSDEFADAAVITETIDGSTFNLSGSIQSVLNLVALRPSQDPYNSFYLEAANWGSSVVPGSFSGAIAVMRGRRARG